jgi:hypothetical protein
MAKGSDLNKTWIASGKGTSNFSANGNIAIPYGRYKATVSGLGAPGNSPTAATYTINYNTNYNIAYPIANQPEAARPVATWNTNYSTNYNIAYPIANQPEAARPVTAWNTNYNVAYPVANRPEAARPVTAWTTNYNVAYPVANRPIANQPTATYNPPIIQLNFQANLQGDGTGPFGGPPFWNIPYSFNFWAASPEVRNDCLAPQFLQQGNFKAYYAYQCTVVGGQNPATWNTNYNTNYNVAYPVGNQPATAWTINYNTNYNVAYPIANQPASTWTINYNTNYNVAYPIANQPIANQPAATYTINYNTNYNIAYPIANQPEAARPVTSYNPALTGTPANVLGVPFPGGLAGNVIDGGPTSKPTVSPTEVVYWDYPDNATYPVTVYPGANVTIVIE